jgi:hypothetical protein
MVLRRKRHARNPVEFCLCHHRSARQSLAEEALLHQSLKPVEQIDKMLGTAVLNNQRVNDTTPHRRNP